MRRRPLSGAIIGILIGLAVAVILARIGVWPPDQLTVFLLPALAGLLGMLVLSMGRQDSTATMVIAFIFLIPMLVWGLLGLGQLNENGQLNGGCSVSADSSVDSTNVTDTSRADPFVVQADSGLSWSAISPEAFVDYDWELYTVVGGISIPLDSGTEANTAGDIENAGDVDDIGEYAADRGIDLDLYRGVYEVGGSAATCDGFGFVHIEADGLDLAAVIATVLILLLVILLLILFFAGRSPAPRSGGARADRDVDVAGALEPYEAGSEDLNGDR